jgi:CHAT domain
VRTGEFAAILRIEIRRESNRRQIALVDPISPNALTIAQDVEASHLKDLNSIVSKQFDEIAGTAQADPILDAADARRLCSDLYIAGFWALRQLLQHSCGVTVDEVQSFCSARVGAARPSVVDIVGHPDDRFFFELLPLLGKISVSESQEAELSELERVILGFRCHVRHRGWGDAGDYSPATDVAVPIPLRFFRHSDLAGSMLELKYLRALQRQGKARVAVEYPPRGFRPPERLPEFQLVRVLANPCAETDDESASLACHFSCHQRRGDEGAYLELKADGFWPPPKVARYRLDRIAVAFDHTPVIPPEARVCFLSACRSATTDPALLISALDALARLRPHSLVGTLARVPELMAAEFTRHFYSAICDGWSVGAAVYAARTKVLRKPLCNPLGILFVSYGGEDVFFRTRADRRGKYIPPNEPARGRAA